MINRLTNSIRSLSGKRTAYFSLDAKPIRNLPASLSLKNSVITSGEKCIYSNLAIEHWLFRTQSFELEEGALFLWLDNPCVVVGKHQNIWQEVNVPFCQKNGVSLARRLSGGGTVFHDSGNINICFLQNRKTYDRKRNLNFLVQVLKDHFDIRAMVNCREDLVLEKGGEKISGSASKLAFDRSYHHCTLLINSNLPLLKNSLQSNTNNFSSNATKSLRSPVLNLQSFNSEIQVKDVMKALTKEYKSWKNITDEHKIFCDDSFMPDVEKTRKELSDWNWIFGLNPKFKLFHRKQASQLYLCEISVQNGLITCLDVQCEHKKFPTNQIILPNLVGIRFDGNEIRQEIQKWSSNQNSMEALFLEELILETINTCL